MSNEITTVEGGEGLSGLMTARKDRLLGILNGIDYEEYNPQTDPYISVNYSKKDAVSGKKENKVALQKELGLPVREDAFLIGIVSRMTSQKGFDLIGCVLDATLLWPASRIIFTVDIPPSIRRYLGRCPALKKSSFSRSSTIEPRGFHN